MKDFFNGNGIRRGIAGTSSGRKRRETVTGGAAASGDGCSNWNTSRNAMSSSSRTRPETAIRHLERVVKQLRRTRVSIGSRLSRISLDYSNTRSAGRNGVTGDAKFQIGDDATGNSRAGSARRRRRPSAHPLNDLNDFTRERWTSDRIAERGHQYSDMYEREPAKGSRRRRHTSPLIDGVHPRSGPLRFDSTAGPLIVRLRRVDWTCIGRGRYYY